MQHLAGRVRTQCMEHPVVLRLTDDPYSDMSHAEALLVDSANAIESGFASYVFPQGSPKCPSTVPAVFLSKHLTYLGHGDIVQIDPGTQRLAVMYRRHSPHNSFLLTERCNSYCIMCSQPPREVDDSFLVDDILSAIPLMSKDTEACGFTGGEPTLLGSRLIELIESMHMHLPTTELHILTNGRRLQYLRFAQRLAQVGHPYVLWAVPLYSDLSDHHNYVVQAEGAFDETIRGITNLARVGQAVEIRMVIQKATYSRLLEFAQFIVRNLPFVSHVALMGLEMMGHVKMNLDAVWIDPRDYQDDLRRCVELLTAAGVPTSIYNHQLCVLDEALWPYAAQSISDWKNEYLPICEQCRMRPNCGGFFESSLRLRYSDHITPFS